MLDTEGGALVELAVGLVIVTGAAAICYDLYNCYKNGYDEVKSSVPPRSVSGGDAY